MAVSCFWLPAAASAQESGPSIEYKVKAAYLLNFCKLVQWPAEAHSSELSPIVVGIVGKDPFGPVLDRTFALERAEGRPLVVERLREGDDLSRCHLVFVGASEGANVERILAAVDGRPVLTVGETPGFGERGGMINFTAKEGAIRFETNPDSAKRVHLRLSYKMIRLSRIVATVRPAEQR